MYFAAIIEMIGSEKLESKIPQFKQVKQQRENGPRKSQQSLREGVTIFTLLHFYHFYIFTL